VLWALTWIYLANGAGMGPAAPMADMPGMADMPAMPGMAMPGAPQDAATSAWLITMAMWWTMMVAMMTPSAAPTVLLYARVYRHEQQQGKLPSGPVPSAAFVAGYFLSWLAFSLLATALQLALQHARLLSMPAMALQARWWTAATLIATGLYQFSPLKTACLAQCRAPAAFLSRHWRPGAGGALRLGVLHGGWCIGCCWLLMALLFVGGVMNLAWIAALSLLVVAEKLFPGGSWFVRIAGVALLTWGAVILFQAA
jgi:predicted metal-binding membrane protein